MDTRNINDKARDKNKIALLNIDELHDYYFPKRLTALYTQPLFNCTLAYSKLMTGTGHWEIYNEVCPHVYLGRIPENNILPEGVRLIVSLVTYGELAEVNFNYNYLAENGIRHLFIHIEDFSASAQKQAIINAINTMIAYTDSNGREEMMTNSLPSEDVVFNQTRDSKVYIHCKAGRARSGMIVAVYMAYKEITKIAMDSISSTIISMHLSAAITKIKETRAQVDIGIEKFQLAHEILNDMIMNNHISVLDQAKIADEKEYLCSLQFKNNVCQFPSFKKICTHLASLREGQMRAAYLQEFLASILYACTPEDATDWYYTLCTGASVINKFVKASPNYFKFNNKDEREQLVSEFKLELESHLTRQFPNHISPVCEQNNIYRI